MDFAYTNRVLIFCIMFVLSSPKRSRRQSRQETERPPTTHNLDSENNSERDLKHHRRLQDDVPLDAPSVQDSKSERTPRKPSENVAVKDDGIKESSDLNEGSRHRSSKHSTNPSVIPHSTSFFQVSVLCTLTSFASCVSLC